MILLIDQVLKLQVKCIELGFGLFVNILSLLSIQMSKSVLFTQFKQQKRSICIESAQCLFVLVQIKGYK